MNVFIVYAHPEPQSFNAAMKNRAVQTLTESGHDVRVSDLYAMRWKAVANADDVRVRHDPTYFRVGRESAKAYFNGQLVLDIVDEQEKLVWCDALVFQFPLWWYAMPAILKGWGDRVLTGGFAYGEGQKYETGKLKLRGQQQRRGMLALTTGEPRDHYQGGGRQGALHDVLRPIEQGIFAYVGLAVLPAFVAWEAPGVSAAVREQYLAEYAAHLNRSLGDH